MPTNRRYLLYACCVALTVDQASKLIVAGTLPYAHVVEFIPGVLDFIYMRNPGGPLGYLAAESTLLRAFVFIGVTIVGIGLLLIYFRRIPEDSRLTSCALGLVLGGVLGNLIDRARLLEVVDFLSVHITTELRSPIFNLADLFVLLGLLLLLLQLARRGRWEAGDLGESSGGQGQRLAAPRMEEAQS